MDLGTGCYPAFLFGGSLGKLLPVFHFHDVTPAYLEPYLRYLAENQYRTVVSDDIHHMLKTGVHTGPRTVALCFDDAWASIWTVVYPMLRQYNLTAITYAIPARVPDAAAPRPLPSAASSSAGGHPHATWPELQELLSSGVVDVQAHTLTHAMIYCDDRPTGFVTPTYAPPALAEPLLNDATPPEFLSAADLGAPIYPCRSRCSDASRFYPDSNGIASCQRIAGTVVDYASGRNGKNRYMTSSPRRRRWETAEETQRAITGSGRSKGNLECAVEDGYGRHLCFLGRRRPNC